MSSPFEPDAPEPVEPRGEAAPPRRVTRRRRCPNPTWAAPAARAAAARKSSAGDGGRQPVALELADVEAGPVDLRLALLAASIVLRERLLSA